MSIKNWKILKSRLVFEHQWYKLRQDEVELPGGRVVDDYFVSVRPDVAVIFAVTEDEEVVLVKQYKHGIGEVVVELPGGVIDEGEDPLTAAQRELGEETGYSSSDFVPLAQLIDNPTKDTNKIYLFGAFDVRLTSKQDLDENEHIEVLTMPLKDVKNEILEGRIKVSGSVAAIFLGLNHLESRIKQDS